MIVAKHTLKSPSNWDNVGGQWRRSSYAAK